LSFIPGIGGGAGAMKDAAANAAKNAESLAIIDIK